MRKGEKTKRKREKETVKKERGRARNSVRKEKKRGGISTGGSAEALHTEELENALFRLHSHRFRWVCREREIPAKWLLRVILHFEARCSSHIADSSGPSAREREREEETYLIYRQIGRDSLRGIDSTWLGNLVVLFQSVFQISLLIRTLWSDNCSHFCVELNTLFRNLSKLKIVTNVRRDV